MADQKKNKLIVFDIDDTLTKSAHLHQLAFAESLHEMGVQDMDKNFGDYKHHTDSYIAKVIYEKDRGEVFSDELMDQFEALVHEKIKRIKFNEIQGAKMLIDFLKTETNYGICFATGSVLEPARHKLRSIGVSFDEVQLVASNRIHERENIVQCAIDQAMEFYKTEAFDRIISVGDGLWDFKTAINLGIEFVGIGEKNKQVLLENGAKTVLNDLIAFKNASETIL